MRNNTTDIEGIDYSPLDRPEILMALFHPRKEWRIKGASAPGEELLIPVDENVVVGARFHPVEQTGPTILFFHGNGEIVADYDEMAPVYNRMGINFLPVDYRGYGRSTGTPTITAMMGDCHRIFDFTMNFLEERGYRCPVIVMGRSLGSASALELASRHKDQIDALIIESGFARSGPLLELLGVNLEAIGFKEDEDIDNRSKIKACHKPTLIIHAEKDHIIPSSDAQDLYEASGARDKQLLMIPGANHNDIFFQGMEEYLKAVKALADKIG
jgi:alpha-beta hydrolase superfamily lysophospholipase